MSYAIPAGRCCPCERRVAFNHQCVHELRVDGKLSIEKYNNRWLNDHAYDRIEPRTRCNPPPDVDDDEVKIELPNTEDPTEREPDDHSVTVELGSDDENMTLSQAQTKVGTSFTILKEHASTLIHLVSDDKHLSAELLDIFRTLSTRLRHLQSIIPHFDLTIANDRCANMPLSGTSSLD